MSKSRRPTRPPGAPAPEEEAALWRLVTRDVAPVRKKARVHPATDALPSAVPPASTKIAAPVRPPDPPRPVRAPAPPAARPRPAALPVAVTPVAITRRKTRKIATGQLEIGARLDLHGLTQAAAHAALRRFLAQCQADEIAVALIITGKGARGADADEPGGWMDRPARGVLREKVPQWLAEPELARLVVSTAKASARHGGDGALYVHVRKRARRR